MDKVSEGVYRGPIEEFYPIIKEHGAEPEALEQFWEEFCSIKQDEDFNIKKEFLWFPAGTNESDICKWFDEKYPGGLYKLIKQRSVKKHGLEHWEWCEKELERTRSFFSHLFSEPPELQLTRQRQKERHRKEEC